MLLLCTSCASVQVSDDPIPVWMPFITSVSSPSSTTAGDEVTFTVDWFTGGAPFTVAWAMGGGTTVETQTFTTSDRTSSATFTLAGLPQSVTYNGTVQVTDSYGQADAMVFSYTVDGN
jgi:hypothetical protein